MKRASLFAAAAAMFIGSSVANASWTFSVTKTSSATGANSTVDVYRYFAKLTATGSDAGAAGLQSVDATLTIPSGSFVFGQNDLNGDGYQDVDPFANQTGSTFRGDTTLAGNGARSATPAQYSFIRTGDPGAGSFSLVALYPRVRTVDGQPTYNPNSAQEPSSASDKSTSVPDTANDPDGTLGLTIETYDPLTIWNNNLKTFRVSAIYSSGGKDTKAVSDPLGSGALFAMAVVPRNNAAPTISGTVASDKGPLTTISVPEPGTFGLLGMGVVGLLSKRRRKA